MPLRAATLVYLYIPLAIFLGGWLRPGLAISLIAAMAAAGLHFRAAFAAADGRAGRRCVAIAALLALGWTALGGAGGVGFQRDDWLKHNAVLKDLVEKNWPADYQVGDRPATTVRPLVFYLAYYLPAALVGKVAGWTAANVALFVWTWLGTTLVLLWYARLVGARAGAMLFFILAGGLEIVGYILGKGYAPAGPLALDWWGHPWNFATNSSLLFWAPHQSIGGWLASALVLNGYERDRSPREASLEAFAAAFWSPFATLGLLPFWALRMARQPKEWLASWPNWSLFPLLAAVLTSYYASVHQPIPWRFLAGEIFGPLWIRYLLIVILEWGALLALCRPLTLPGRRAPWVIAAVSLALIPFFSMGLFNDFCMRASIPALLVLWIVIGRRVFGRLEAPGWGRRPAAALLLAAFVGTAGAVLDMKTSLRGFRVATPEFDDTAEVHLAYPDRRIGAQYLGERDSWFFRRLARPLRQ